MHQDTCWETKRFLCSLYTDFWQALTSYNEYRTTLQKFLANIFPQLQTEDSLNFIDVFSAALVLEGNISKFNFCFYYFNVNVSRIYLDFLPFCSPSFLCKHVSFHFENESQDFQWHLGHWRCRKCFSWTNKTHVKVIQLQARTNYLKKTLVCMWNSALREKSNNYFQTVFC